MPEIKAKVAQRRTCEDVAIRRNLFNNRTVALLVDSVIIRDHNRNQEKYMNRLFNPRKRPLTFTDVKQGYYGLVSEDYFKNLYPSFTFDTVRQHFNFRLSKRPQNNFQADFGGVVATRNISNLYLGLSYYYFNRLLTHISANFQTGGFYQSAQVKARLDFAGDARFYLEPEATKHDPTTDFIPSAPNRPSRCWRASVSSWKTGVSGGRQGSRAPITAP